MSAASGWVHPGPTKRQPRGRATGGLAHGTVRVRDARPGMIGTRSWLHADSVQPGKREPVPPHRANEELSSSSRERYLRRLGRARRRAGDLIACLPGGRRRRNSS